MIATLIKFRLLLIAVILLFCIKFVESPYFGDYYQNSPIHIYFLVTLTNVLIYLIPTQKIILAEKIIYGAVISALTLIGVGFLIESVLGSIYGYDLYYGELKSPEILTDALFYFISNFASIGIFAFWLRKKQVKA